MFTKSIKSSITLSGVFPSRKTHVNCHMSSSSFSGLPSRTTLCIIFPTKGGRTFNVLHPNITHQLVFFRDVIPEWTVFEGNGAKRAVITKSESDGVVIRGWKRENAGSGDGVV